MIRLPVGERSLLAPGLALIFDLDGVIVDSNQVHAETWAEYMRRCGVEPDDGMPQRMYGRRNDEIVRDLFGNSLSAEAVAAHGSAKEALFRDVMRGRLECHLVPGVTPFLHRHRTAPIGLATNAERANVDLVLDGAGLRPYFRVVVDGQQVRRPKPDPEIYLHAASLLGAEPRNCIVFEDSHAGIAAARAAGTRVVGVMTTHQAFSDAGLNIGDFLSAELEPWLHEQRPAA